MKTIVLQSYRTYDVPLWISLCLESVQKWAKAEGWTYELSDDRFLHLAPDWVNQHCGNNIYALTDACRLAWVRSKLRAGYDRVIWVDADVLVFSPSKLIVATPNGHGFAHELFIPDRLDGELKPVEGMNNSVMVFEQGQTILLDDYYNACLDRLRAFPAGAVPRTALGPRLLEELGCRAPLHALHGVGLFTLAIMREIANGTGGPLTQAYARLAPAPLGAANLCHFLRNATPVHDRPRFDAIYESAVRAILEPGQQIFSAPS